MKKTRHLALAITLFAAAGGICAQAQDLGPTLSKIKETRMVTIGHRESSIPFSYLDGQQKPVGFALDICARVVDAIKAHLKLDRLDVGYVSVTSASRIPLLVNGSIDMECGSTTNNLERQKQVAFTNTHYLTANRFVSKRSSNLKSIDDLKGKSVASTAGTTNIRQLTEANNARSLGINIVSAKDHAEGFLLVERGWASAFVMDDILLASLVANARQPDEFVISEEAFSKPEPYGIMLRRDDPQFKALVDEATARIYSSPEMAALYRKWFQAPIPPNDLNLNVPMGAALKAAFAKPTDSANPDDY